MQVKFEIFQIIFLHGAISKKVIEPESVINTNLQLQKNNELKIPTFQADAEKEKIKTIKIVIPVQTGIQYYVSINC